MVFMEDEFKFCWEEGHEEDDAEITIKLPSFRKDEIKVRLASNSVTISAAKKNRKEEKGKDFYRFESSASSFSRSMTLPYRIKPEDFDVIISDGSVTLKRKRKKQAEEIGRRT